MTEHSTRGLYETRSTLVMIEHSTCGCERQTDRSREKETQTHGGSERREIKKQNQEEVVR